MKSQENKALDTLLDKGVEFKIVTRVFGVKLIKKKSFGKCSIRQTM